MEKLIITNKQNEKKEVSQDSISIYDKYFLRIKQVEWVHEGKNYLIQNMYAYYPSFNLERIVVLHTDLSEFKYPSNLVIYNADKTVYKIVSVPEFINEEVLQNRIVPENKIECFENFGNIIEIDAVNHVIVAISTNAYMGSRMGLCTSIEERALNIETGNFHTTWNKGGIYW